MVLVHWAESHTTGYQLSALERRHEPLGDQARGLLADRPSDRDREY
jgi:hypothetical protein